ncbi:uncharacterized protein LOC133492024 isoform X2 [Syngnathoides biaculeatus]|uniref:uncharacterized protein LOC133492024 isoform X2 n=1 Tax=Syngnathoides biaculeatus TaxID=300417 RepID=UPI002ADE053D|nr:uncharacterized protein LOC133492024 isoform X2 [Syngnathoides biaculeatus]
MFRAKRAVKARADTPFRGPLKRGHDGGRHPHKKLKAMSMEELEDGAVAGAGHVRFQPSGDIRPITSTSGTATAAGVERVGHVSLGHPRCHVRPSPPQTGPTGTISENSSDSTDYDDVCDSSTSSSVPSPEVFRHDSYGMPDFFSEDVPATPVDQKHQVKNSTLRGSARVASGRRHQHASVSTVLYASPHTNTQMSNKGAIADNLQTSRVRPRQEARLLQEDPALQKSCCCQGGGVKSVQEAESQSGRRSHVFRI